MLGFAPISALPISGLEALNAPAPTIEPLGQFSGAQRTGGGPDAQVSMADWLRRFGRVDLPPETVKPVEVNDDDEDAIALLLCALVE